MLSLREASQMLPGSRLVGPADLVFERVHSDTRTLRAGDLFVALRGERFDAHDFLAQARAAGAVAALAERDLSETLPGIEVADSLAALQALAGAWRARFTLPLVAVTGSNGKTTVTQMVAAILRAAFGGAAFATQGNLNNHIGVPLTLLRLRDTHRAGVVELGMNHVGEIALLAAIARPTVALVNNAQREHQEFMATVEAVARENGAAIESLAGDGTAVFPAGCCHSPLWQGLAGCRRTVRFGLEGEADGVADVLAGGEWQAGAWNLVLRTPVGTAHTRLAQAGRHNLKNAAAAAACAIAAGIPLAAIEQGLAAFAPVAGRSQSLLLRREGREITLVDDSYNANPDSALAAVAVLAGLPAPRWLLLGDMGEVGERGPEFHAEVGAAARKAGIETVWTAGKLSEHVGADRHFADAPALVAALADAPTAASVLVKGSRFMKMEHVVQALRGEGA